MDSAAPIVGARRILYLFEPVSLLDASAKTSSLTGVSAPPVRPNRCDVPQPLMRNQFLMARAYQTDAQAETVSPFVLVQNFFEELKARVSN